MQPSSSPALRVAHIFLYVSSALILAACGGAPGNIDEVGANAASSDSSGNSFSMASSVVNPEPVRSSNASPSIFLGGKKRGGTVTPPPPATVPMAACSFTYWVDSFPYVAGNIVKYVANGKFYKATHDNPGYDPTISTWYWDPQACDPATSTMPSTTAPGSFVVSEAQFNQLFPARNAFYSYAGLVAAMSAYPAIFNTGSDTVKKQEAAAFLAHIDHETSGLLYIRESNQANWPLYCQSGGQYPCAPGQQYYGRGPIQLSWNYNYGAAGDALGLNLLADPDMVARDATVAWKTAVWYWVTQYGGAAMPPHQAMVYSVGFAETIRAVNGGLECNQPAGSSGNLQMQSRVAIYLSFTQILGVPAGNNLTC